MQYLKTVTFPFARLKLPGDFAERLGSQRVKAMAESFRTVGMLQPPAMRDTTHEIIFGADRIAALHLLGHNTIEVRVFCCSDDEAKAARIIENLHRRPDDVAKLTAELIAIKLQHRTETTERVSQRGRPKSSRTKAIEAVASETGSTAEAVRKAAGRAETKQEPADDDFGPFGPPCPENVKRAALAALEALGEAKSLASRLGSALRRLEDGGFDATLLHTVKQQRDALSHELRQLEPVGVCPCCRAAKMEQCPACRGRGYAVRRQMDHCPRELVDRGKPERRYSW
jgi:hypothetical protein